MMKQYFQLKQENPGTLLFFRLGDFYEMFFDDAKIASRELDLTLTGRDCGLEERAPMCGVPFHSYETYLARLVQKGYQVAICEQMEDPFFSPRNPDESGCPGFQAHPCFYPGKALCFTGMLVR